MNKENKISLLERIYRRWINFTLVGTVRKDNHKRNSLTNTRRLADYTNHFAECYSIEPLKDPQEPIMAIDESTLSVRNASHNYRMYILLPWVAALWCVFLYQAYEFGPNRGMISYAHDNIQRNLELKSFGYDYDKNDDNYYRALVGDSGKGSRIDLFIAVHKYGDENYRKSIYEEVAIISLLFILSLMIATVFFRFYRRADIFFDREYNIVYTWHLGKLFYSSFNNLTFREDKCGLKLFLHHKDWSDRGNTTTRYFYVQGTGRVFMNTENDNTFLLTQICAFMSKGISAVIQDNSFFRPMFVPYLRVDKRPEDFKQKFSDIVKDCSESAEMDRETSSQSRAPEIVAHNQSERFVTSALCAASIVWLIIISTLDYFWSVQIPGEAILTNIIPTLSTGVLIGYRYGALLESRVRWASLFNWMMLQFLVFFGYMMIGDELSLADLFLGANIYELALIFLVVVLSLLLTLYIAKFILTCGEKIGVNLKED
ncbi:hypothetical protein [Vibrio hepatarius]|uniref:hypothetical protein n=1 Tax=Vibrio hepatarius TaxID=171383 RepID=UPI001C082F51|nr:hypothetical protein [Vibrio hepatarius]MBU2895579.1 hypothetical protein [Vibrio hepatarius]